MLKIGTRIRDLRKSRKVTLVELSEKTGVAQATLSRIETGTMIGTVESHQRIAEALGVGLGDLYSGIDSRAESITHTKPEERKAEKREKTTIQLLTSSALKKKMAPVLITLEGPASLPLEKEEVGVEKFIYCLKGEVELSIEKNKYRIKNQESIYFDASLSHSLSNLTSRTAEVFSITSPPRI
jgi:transcriptional regulator with XRE-family HTH domain